MIEQLTYRLDQFEGPLDLLLTLISKNKVSITDIPIAIICDQYMEYIEQAQKMDLDIASEFIVMASELMLIKSKMILPHEEGTENDPRREIADALLLYQQAKLAAKELKPLYDEFSTRYVKDTDEVPPETIDLLAMVNGKLKELRKCPKDGDIVEFITVNSETGIKTYRRGMVLVFLKAVYTVLGSKGLEKVRIEHAIGKGIYGEFEGKVQPTEENLAKIKAEMERLIAADLPFEKRVVSTEEAKEIFRRHRMYDKEKLFGYRRVSKTNIYSLGGFEDYFYGYMPASTGSLKIFDLFPYAGGFMLMLPDRDEPDVIPAFKEQKKFFDVLQESSRWGRIMGVETVGDMNSVLARGELGEMILVQEALMEKKIGDIAAQIAARGNVKFVMIAGPSSSGKTTFSHRLSIQLRTLGMRPHLPPRDPRQAFQRPHGTCGSFAFCPECRLFW